jgi:hypothetical protein
MHKGQVNTMDCMNWFNRLPGYKRTPYGMERPILNRLPSILLAGTVLPGVALLAVWLNQGPDVTAAQQRAFWQLSYMVLGFVILHWTLVLTVAIGCVIVMIMKGPAYVADAYPVSHRDTPALCHEDDAKPASATKVSTHQQV